MKPFERKVLPNKIKDRVLLSPSCLSSVVTSADVIANLFFINCPESLCIAFWASINMDRGCFS